MTFGTLDAHSEIILYIIEHTITHHQLKCMQQRFKIGILVMSLYIAATAA